MVRVSSLKGYEILKDIYYINDDLEIMSSYRTLHKIKPRLNSSGYTSYPLIKKDGRQMTVLLHRVIALAYIKNPNNYDEINHKDEDKLNNSIGNLEWCTHKYNCNYGTRTKRYSEKALKPVKQIDGNGTTVAIYPGVIKATKELKLKSKSAITNCIAGRSKTCHGHRWEYV